MAFIPVTNCAEVSLEFAQPDGEFAENTWGVQNSAPWTLADLTTMGTAFNHWWYTGDGTVTYRGQQPNTCTLIGSVVRDLTTQTSDTVTVPANEASNVGVQTSNFLENGITKAMTARTGLSGRSFRGRTFLIQLNAASLASGDPNLFSAASMEDYVDFMEALISAVPAAVATCSLVVISRRHNNAPRGTGVTTPIVHYGYHDLYVDYQRRRAPGHNRHH